MQMIYFVSVVKQTAEKFCFWLPDLTTPVIFTLSQKPQGKGGWGENPTHSDEGDSHTF